jgi:hypothetical protein
MAKKAKKKAPAKKKKKKAAVKAKYASRKRGATKNGGFEAGCN